MAGCGSPMMAKMIFDNGADTLNPIGDITPAQLAAIRSVVKKPLDIFITMVDAMGGMHRFHEAADIIRVGAPTYLKIESGASEDEQYKSWTDVNYQNALCREKVKLAQSTIEWIQRMNPDLVLSAPGPDDLTLCC